MSFFLNFKVRFASKLFSIYHTKSNISNFIIDKSLIILKKTPKSKKTKTSEFSSLYCLDKTKKQAKINPLFFNTIEKTNFICTIIDGWTSRY